MTTHHFFDVHPEGFIVKSLHDDDGLVQTEIGVLLGRHQSWVSRRLKLVDELDAEVQENIRLGLLSVVAGRELARMPRGIQQEVMAKILKYGLSTREVSKLVGHLLTRPKWEYPAILAQPWELFETPPAQSDLRGRVSAMHRICRGVVGALEKADAHEMVEAHGVMDTAIASAERATSLLKRLVGGAR